MFYLIVAKFRKQHLPKIFLDILSFNHQKIEQKCNTNTNLILFNLHLYLESIFPEIQN
jgi:hypothetical protein